MLLDEQDMARIRSIFAQRGLTWPPLCSICQHRDWGVNTDLVGLPAVNREGSLDEPLRHAPQLYLTCNHCSHTLMFTTVQMGLTD
jgi:hypothetical protein